MRRYMKRLKILMGIFVVLAVISLNFGIKNVYAESDDSVVIAERFPDERFRKYVSDEFDKDKDGILSLNEYSKVYAIRVDNLGISDLTGIEVFKNIDSLYCSRNNLTSLDISKNTRLQWLNCCDNKLKNVDLSNNLCLLYIAFCGNLGNELDISNCKYAHDGIVGGSESIQSGYYDMLNRSFTFVELKGTKLVYHNPSTITDFKALYDEVTLEVGDEFERDGSPYLHFFTEPERCSSVFDVDIQGDKNVIIRDGFNYKAVNPGTVIFTVTATNGNKKTSIKINVVKKVAGIAINEKNFPDKAFREYISSSEINLDNNNELSRDEIEKAVSFNLRDKNIKSLKGMEFFYNLRYMYASGNQLTELDISKNQNLRTVQVDESDIKTIDISRNYMLDSFSCDVCGLENLVIGRNNRVNLKSLSCEKNCLKNLDLSNVPELESISCRYNYLKNVDISKNKKLNYIGIDKQFDKPVTGFNTAQKNIVLKKGEVYELPLCVYPLDTSTWSIKYGSPLGCNSVYRKYINGLGHDNDWRVTLYLLSNTVGTDTIIIYTNNGAKKLKLNITVTETGKVDNKVSVASIKLDKSEYALKSNDYFVLNSTVYPENSTDDFVDWSSDNPDVASVCCGVVKGIKKGTAVITAKTRDGGKTAKCVVKVDGGETTEKKNVDQKSSNKTDIKVLKAGSSIKDTKNNVKYKVLKSSANGTGAVAFVGVSSKKKTSVKIPDTITSKGVKYKVTEIKANALKNNKKVKTVTIGKNVTKIGKNAFYGCKKLKTIKIKSTKLTSKRVGKKAFSKVNAKVKVKVPKSKKKAYKKWLYKKGLPKKAKIS